MKLRSPAVTTNPFPTGPAAVVGAFTAVNVAAAIEATARPTSATLVRPPRSRTNRGRSECDAAVWPRECDHEPVLTNTPPAGRRADRVSPHVRRQCAGGRTAESENREVLLHSRYRASARWVVGVPLPLPGPAPSYATASRRTWLLT